ncbi:hypothetical protein HMPREF1550_00503 [Actinomyces sp. oral taxon 877 str. F0543]|nr:hypothetical protein HMPREF1550_00503 [Actinomyces sp. oral taxon 877 str. F0543]
MTGFGASATAVRRFAPGPRRAGGSGRPCAGEWIDSSIFSLHHNKGC